MLDGILTPALRDIDYLAPAAPYPVIPSGTTIHQNPVYRYSIPTDEQPTLSIIDAIPDYNGNFILPGFYQLALSDDREFLYLIESKNLVAVIIRIIFLFLYMKVIPNMLNFIKKRGK